SLVDLLANPTGAIGAAIALPFLNVAEMRLTNQAARTAYQEAQTIFRQTLVVALSDVETALSARVQAGVQGERLRESLDAAQIAERLNEVRYRAGAASLREWLDSQERRRSAEIAVLDNRLQQLNGHVTLYQALGGDAAL
ncbi:MAG: TolC family protein, partial [Phenylobacterium sp.]|nr:TolC family protein [Phenylobacterium sp.]